MAAIIWSDVSGAFAELTATPLVAQTLFLAIVNGTGLDAENFGGEDAALTKTARVFLAAHLATLARRQGIGGGIASQTEGGASQNYFNAFIGPRMLHLTAYGQMFAGLIAGTPARAGTLV